MVLSSLCVVSCNFCGTRFRRELRRIKENKKIGHSFYCSRSCQFRHQKTGTLLVCENSKCKKEFYRAKNDILAHNYCSQSCAAIVNNCKYPKHPFKICVRCATQFHGPSRFCSPSCAKASRFLRSKNEIIAAIRDLYAQLGRAPAKRESQKIYRTAEIQFGSWNNAIAAAGLQPNRSDDHRMYKRTRTRSADGHLCDSVSEAIIDNWLHTHNIAHKRDVFYPVGKYKADWMLENGTYVEYFGLAKDSRRYDRDMAAKQNICRERGITLVAIYPNDLYPTLNLDEKLRSVTA